MAKGGRRPGSGRKPKSAFQHGLQGTVSEAGRARVLAHPSAVDTAPPPIEEFDAPNDLMTDERLVWMELAPFAFQNRTLVPATSLSFRLLCRNVVLERAMAASVLDRGGASHRGMIQRVDAELLRFNLSPCGKAIYQEPAQEQPVNPLAKFMKRRA